MRRLIAALVLVVVPLAWVTLAGEGTAHACSCMASSDAELVERADVIFSGTLAGVVTPPGDDWMDPEWFVFAVDTVYKGAATETQAVETAREGASCGLEIWGTGPFLVFASGRGELSSNLCSGTRRLSDGPLPEGLPPGVDPQPGGAIPDIAELGPPPPSPYAEPDPTTPETTTAPVTIERPDATGTATGWWIAGGAAAALAVAALFVVVRRR